MHIKEQLQAFDYIFFFNANYVILKPVSEEDFLPLKEDLLVCQHPFYTWQPSYLYPYERRRESTAYIPYTAMRAHDYVCGGLNGGKCSAFLELIELLDHNIKTDARNGIIAVWHDESHINHYITTHTNYKKLPASYAYPEMSYDLPFDKIMFLRDKKKYIALEKREPQKVPTFEDLNGFYQIFIKMIELVKRCIFRK